jgi:large subunit ribosomal protein L24
MATKLRVRKGDRVKVIAGKSAGHVGNVLRTDPKNAKVWVEGANVQKRHQKPRTLRDVQRGGQVGGIIEAEGPLHVSNVMLVDPGSNQPTRVGLRRDDEGRRVRVAKRSGKDID